MATSVAQQWQTERLSHWLVHAWGKSFCEVVSALDMNASIQQLDLKVREPQPEGWQQWEQPQWFDLSVDVSEGAILSVGCAKETVARIAAVIIGESDVDEATAGQTYLEVLNQVGSSVSSAVSEKLGSTVQFAQAVEGVPPENADLGVDYLFILQDAEWQLAVVPNTPFLEGIQPPEETAQPEAAEAASASAAGASTIGEAAPQASPGRPAGSDKTSSLAPHAWTNLSMLLDIELDLSISFGKTDLPMQEVLKLSSGSIVELNRAVSDPVEVIVNNRVIARGEVVVVDGNYGIRIKEIVSQQERIRSIF